MTGKEAHNEYIKQWRKEHPEKRKEYDRRYWEKKAILRELELKGVKLDADK